MKSSYINKLFSGVALAAMVGFSACTGDLDQMPKDPNTLQANKFAENPREYLAGVMAKCYSGIAVSGQGGAGSSDISGLDNGTSQYTRALFMLNEFPTDEVMWIWQDAGVVDLVEGNWGSDNVNIYGTYSRLYTHIAICNDFLRLSSPSSLGENGINVDESLQKDIDQFRLEARALRAMSYYNIIDLFGRAVVAWDDMPYGEVPQQAESRAALYDKVVADLEDVLEHFPEDTPVYGRVGKDGVEALLCRFYLNAGVYTGTPQWAKCYEHAQNIIRRHQGGGFQGSGLATDYLSLFCSNNDMFMPGGSLPAQNEILWGIPYQYQMTETYGGASFLILAATTGATEKFGDGYAYCNNTWYGLNTGWTCMHARQQFSEKFGFVNGVSSDKRTAIWITERGGNGFTITNDDFSTFSNGYLPIKFTNVKCNPDGTMPVYIESDSIPLPRAGVKPVDASAPFADTDLPLIRLADVYLMAAECTLNGAGDKATGLQYANVVRQRAGLSPWNSAEFNESILLDERARELYWECVRRTDLIRHNKFTGNAYNWNWKNGVPSGTPYAEYRNLYPIPSNVTAVYGSSYKQNPGYN